jgi:hypothetical protein
MDDEIRRRDLQVFAKEFVSPLPLIGFLVAGLILSGGAHNPFVTLFTVVAMLGLWSLLAWNSSKRKRFHDNHFLDLWHGCEERHTRFTQVFERGKKRELSGVTEMPRTIDEVKASVYRALRKADLIAYELSSTEGDLGNLPKPKRDVMSDQQSQELLQVADRNVAEYRQGLNNLMAGVQRTEAQAAVFMTTIDSLRMRMLGHRLVGRSPEMGSHELLAAMAEAKLQLQSIDKALDELDLGLFPQRISPPSPSARAGVSGVRPSPPPPPAGVVFAKENSGLLHATDEHQEVVEDHNQAENKN